MIAEVFIFEWIGRYYMWGYRGIGMLLLRIFRFSILYNYVYWMNLIKGIVEFIGFCWYDVIVLGRKNKVRDL